MKWILELLHTLYLVGVGFIAAIWIEDGHMRKSLRVRLLVWSAIILWPVALPIISVNMWREKRAAPSESGSGER